MNEVWWEKASVELRAARMSREGRVLAAEEIHLIELSACSHKQTLSSLPNWGSSELQVSPG